MGKLRQSTEQIQGILDNAVTGENLKTINGQSLLGKGNIEIEGGGGGIVTASDMNSDFNNDF